MAIERPVKLYDFGSVQVAPTYEIDRQFDNHRRSIDQIIRQLAKVLRADDKLNNAVITPESFPPNFLASLRSEIVNEGLRASEAAFTALKRIGERQAEIERSVAELRGLIRQNMADNQVTRTLGAGVQARAATLSAAVSQAIETIDEKLAGYEPVLGYGAGGFYGADPAGADATASDYAQVAIEWAEHMPDTIPPNILAINAITGEHWSSRWWAMKSANAFGMMAMLYCGASSVPPTQTLTGDPLTEGCLYFDTNTNTMQVWNGSGWQPFTIPQKAFTSSLYYLANAGQRAFLLTMADLYNNTFTINAEDPEGIEVYVNGARLTPDNNPGMITGDFFVNVMNSTITLAQALPAGAMVAIDVLQTASQLAPGAVAIMPIQNINTPPGYQDGVRASFVLTVKADGTYPNLAGPEELLVSIDGVLQEAGIQYSASGDTVTFGQAPASDAYVFISWFKTPLNNTPLGAAS